MESTSSLQQPAKALKLPSEYTIFFKLVGDASWILCVFCIVFISKYDEVGKSLSPARRIPFFPPHTTWDVSPDCSKVTPNTQILPSLVGTHNNTLPGPPLPPILSLHSFSSIQLPVWSSDWLILICSTHIPRLDIAKQPPLAPLSATDCFWFLCSTF